jgi:Zn-dependent protease with chaperone function
LTICPFGGIVNRIGRDENRPIRRPVISAQRPFDTTAYRQSSEHLILALTLILVLLVIVLTATATFCLSGVFVLAMGVISYFSSRSTHQELLQSAWRITPQDTPALAALVGQIAARLRPGSLEVFVAEANTLNAYTFGLSSPKVIVLHAPLLQVMDPDELRFIVGHEMGHVRLGHTVLNSLVGGMAGIPSPFLASALLTAVFLWWNRACETSADRAGLLACGRLDKAVLALVKLAADTTVRTQADVERALAHIRAEDEGLLGDLGEVLATHPLMAHRIERLQRYARTAEYRRLQGLVDRNVGLTR